MALIQCRECGGSVSTQASACPKCGARRVPAVNGVRVLVLLVLGALAFWYWGTQGAQFDAERGVSVPAGP